jgi:hypothetical protein
MTTKILAAAFACLCILSAPAMALDISLGASLGGSASASSGDGGLSLGGGASADADLKYGLGQSTNSMAAGLTANASGAASLTGGDELDQVIALIEDSAWSEDSLSGISDIDATAYDVGAWINADNEAAFDQALSSNAGEIADLQAAVAANASLESWLEAHAATADDVVAIGVAADGSLAVFTN